ncbi:MAG: hypothetical protein UV79_C0021G0005, partial [candidate division TM6 bacterium GW2011_GWF2_43_17]
IQIPLPFDYKRLSLQEKDRVVYVPEYYYTTLKKNSKKIALIGPLHPCKLVIIHNKETGASVLFHKHDSNSTNSLCSIAKQKLGQDTKPEDIQVFIFGLISRSIFQQYKHDALLNRPPKQIDKIKNIRSIIMSYFKIKKEQIKINIFRDEEIATKHHFYGQKFILIDKDVNINCCCPIADNVFNIPIKKHVDIAQYFEEVAQKIQAKINKTEQIYPNYGGSYEVDGFLAT